MSVFGTPEFKVGLLVIIVSAMIAVMSLKVSQNPSYLTSAKEAWFYLDDASGLIRNSNVRMAGIPVGIIRDIRLENGQARIEMVLKGDTPLFSTARIEIRPNGILGDKFVEVIPGDPRDAPFRSGDQILVVDDRASVDRLIGEVSKITKSLTTVADNIKSATEGDTDKPLGRIIANIERVTTDLSELTTQHREDFSEIVGNLRNTTSTIDEMVNDETEDGFRAAWKDALASLRKIEGTIKNLEDITGKVNRGEGTIGKLVNDEGTVEQLNTAIDGINNFLDTSAKTQTSVDYRAQYLLSGEAKSFLSLKIQPGLDRYYEVGVVDDATGSTETTTTTTTPDSGSTSTVREQKRFENRLKLTALLAKSFYNLTLKGGMIENTGGVAAEVRLFRDRVLLSTEFFEFDRLKIRAAARWNVLHGIYLIAGGEDLLGRSKTPTAFLGAGLFLTNDDLKLLVSRLPF
jgi:phospholipid/cholesterol/gamma-HCH transport system substrate-binding protein